MIDSESMCKQSITKKSLTEWKPENKEFLRKISEEKDESWIQGKGDKTQREIKKICSTLQNT